MGLIRIYLALAVALTHIRLLPFNIFPADVAVQVFYVISGFYMGLVLNEKYPANWTGRKIFWRARFMRIFPTYALVAIASLSVFFFSSGNGEWRQAFFSSWNELLASSDRLLGTTYSVVSQATLLGLDGHHFVALSPDAGFHLTADFQREPYQAWHLMAVPQAWTLSLELYFYLLAPLLVTGSLRKLLVFMLASLAIRGAIYLYWGHGSDPWSYRFFPSELALFLAGALAYRLHATRHASEGAGIRFGLRIVGCVVVFMSVFIPRLVSDLPRPYVAPLIAALLFWMIGTIFTQTKNNRFDRTIGELSYPLYISHMLAIWAVESVFRVGGTTGGLLSLTLALVLSYVLYRYFELPLESLRTRGLRSKSETIPPNTPAAVQQ